MGGVIGTEEHRAARHNILSSDGMIMSAASLVDYMRNILLIASSRHRGTN
jgi:hypothetical protein